MSWQAMRSQLSVEPLCWGESPELRAFHGRIRMGTKMELNNWAWKTFRLEQILAIWLLVSYIYIYTSIYEHSGGTATL